MIENRLDEEARDLSPGRVDDRPVDGELSPSETPAGVPEAGVAEAGVAPPNGRFGLETEDGPSEPMVVPYEPMDAPSEPTDAPQGAPEPTLIRLEGRELRKAVEAVLFSLSEPIGMRAMADLLGAPVHDVRQAVEDLRLEYFEQDRAFRIEDIAGGVQILTLKAYDPWIRKLRNVQREGRLSPAALETLAVIAYKQPIHRADLEAIRGVTCGPILKTLLDKGLVKIVGRGEGLGKPLLYGTTRRFLESFGIGSIRELPQPDSDAQAVAPPRPDDRARGALFPPEEPGAAADGGSRPEEGADADAEESLQAQLAAEERERAAPDEEPADEEPGS